jgi:translation initiation factor IF-1
MATVLELMPSAIVRVELDETREQVLAHAGSAREVNFVRMRPGDKVLVEVSPQDPGRGRVKRLLRKP